MCYYLNLLNKNKFIYRLNNNKQEGIYKPDFYVFQILRTYVSNLLLGYP